MPGKILNTVGVQNCVEMNLGHDPFVWASAPWEPVTVALSCHRAPWPHLQLSFDQEELGYVGGGVAGSCELGRGPARLLPGQARQHQGQEREGEREQGLMTSRQPGGSTCDWVSCIWSLPQGRFPSPATPLTPEGN